MLGLVRKGGYMLCLCPAWALLLVLHTSAAAAHATDMEKVQWVSILVGMGAENGDLKVMDMEEVATHGSQQEAENADVWSLMDMEGNDDPDNPKYSTGCWIHWTIPKVGAKWFADPKDGKFIYNRYNLGTKRSEWDSCKHGKCSEWSAIWKEVRDPGFKAAKGDKGDDDFVVTLKIGPSQCSCKCVDLWKLCSEEVHPTGGKPPINKYDLQGKNSLSHRTCELLLNGTKKDGADDSSKDGKVCDGYTQTTVKDKDGNDIIEEEFTPYSSLDPHRYWWAREGKETTKKKVADDCGKGKDGCAGKQPWGCGETNIPVPAEGDKGGEDHEKKMEEFVRDKDGKGKYCKDPELCELCGMGFTQKGNVGTCTVEECGDVNANAENSFKVDNKTKGCPDSKCAYPCNFFSKSFEKPTGGSIWAHICERRLGCQGDLQQHCINALANMTRRQDLLTYGETSFVTRCHVIWHCGLHNTFYRKLPKPEPEPGAMGSFELEGDDNNLWGILKTECDKIFPKEEGRADLEAMAPLLEDLEAMREALRGAGLLPPRRPRLQGLGVGVHGERVAIGG